MRDSRAFVEIKREITGDRRYTLEPASLLNGRRGILATRAGGAERRLAIDFQNGGTVWVVYLEIPNAKQSGDRASIDRFIDSIEMQAI